MKLTKRLAAVVLAAILSLVMLTACSDTLPPDTPDSGYDPQLIQYREDVLRLINEERAKEGLDPLIGIANEALNNAAQKRAAELSTRFSHTRPDGTSWSTVLEECSVRYQWEPDEVIPDGSGLDTPARLVHSIDGLMFSDKARQDILSGRFTQLGIGYVQKDGQHYWALIFIC